MSNHLQSHAFIVNKLCATDLSISPGLSNKVDSIYISILWLRFTLMDRALRVLFHGFQTVFDRIIKDSLFRRDWNKCSQIQLLTSESIGDRAREHKKTRKHNPEFDKKAH